MNRPTGFINYCKVMTIIEDSIASAQNWGEITNDAFNSTERIASLEALLNIVVELQWRYGNAVAFCFTAKKRIDNTVAICDIVSEVNEPWAHRIFVDERDFKAPRVYIKF